MPVAVQSHHPHRSPGAAPARLAVGGGKQTESSRHAPGELLAADRRGEFLAMVLHELQNPLGSILAGVAFVRDTEGLPAAVRVAVDGARKRDTAGAGPAR